MDEYLPAYQIVMCNYVFTSLFQQLINYTQLKTIVVISWYWNHSCPVLFTISVLIHHNEYYRSYLDFYVHGHSFPTSNLGFLKQHMFDSAVAHLPGRFCPCTLFL